MKFCVCFLVAILAMAAPSQALLGAKLAILGALRNSFGGNGNIGGYGNGGGYTNDRGYGYGNGYGGGSGNGGYGIGYNRPVFTGQGSNYGWGQKSYGGGYSSGYNGGYSSDYNAGNEGSVRVIKIIVSREQPETYYDNYARTSSAAASAVSTYSGASWTPIPAPAPVLQTYSVQPVQSLQVSAPAQPVSAPSSVQIPVQAAAPAAVQVIQPPPRSVYIQSQPQPQYYQRSQPTYQQATIQRPIQYPVQQPQPIFRQTQPIYQQPQSLPQNPQSVNTIKLIVDGESQHFPAPSYGAPVPAPNFVAPSLDNSGAWNSDTWNSARSGSGYNNVGNGQWKSGGISESIGC